MKRPEADHMRQQTPVLRQLTAWLTGCIGALIATEPRRCAIAAALVLSLICYTAAGGGLANVIGNGENIAALGAGAYAALHLAHRLRATGK